MPYWRVNVFQSFQVASRCVLVPLKSDPNWIHMCVLMVQVIKKALSMYNLPRDRQTYYRLKKYYDKLTPMIESCLYTKLGTLQLVCNALSLQHPSTLWFHFETLPTAPPCCPKCRPSTLQFKVETLHATPASLLSKVSSLQHPSTLWFFKLAWMKSSRAKMHLESISPSHENNHKSTCPKGVLWVLLC